MRYNEKVFLEAINKGKYKVQRDGTILNVKRNKKIGFIDNQGYRTVAFREGSKVKNVYVHRLVYLFYKGPIKKKYEINHIDGNKLNNTLENLEQLTHRDNVIHAVKTGLINNRSHNHSSAILSKDQVLKIRELHSPGNFSMTELAKKFNASYSTINRIINNKTYKYD